MCVMMAALHHMHHRKWHPPPARCVRHLHSMHVRKKVSPTDLDACSFAPKVEHPLLCVTLAAPLAPLQPGALSGTAPFPSRILICQV